MLKALYLQALYDLSDPALEEALLDRLSFRHFCGFALDAPTPDETTIWRFRKQAGDLLTAAFEEIGRQLAAPGLVVRAGTMIREYGCRPADLRRREGGLRRPGL